MKQLKMACSFNGEGSDRCFVVSISRVPASVVLCELCWSNGIEIKCWQRIVVGRKAELIANVSVCREFGLFILSDWTLIGYKFKQGSPPKPSSHTREDITTELVKRCAVLCKGGSSIMLPIDISSSSSCSSEISQEHSKADLQTLLEKARCIQSFDESPVDFLRCRWLYRNKPLEYFQEIFHFHDGIMKVYIKDNNGDPASCINGRLDGLFFSANVNPKTRKPQMRPIYGDTCLRVSCSKMFEYASNLYFADVYCNTSAAHHVTLVMTDPGSAADRFCLEKLVPLSKTDRTQNPFLFFEGTQAYVSTRIVVEVLYTEDVDVGECLRDTSFDSSLDRCPVRSYSKRHLGRSKNLSCPQCNL